MFTPLGRTLAALALVLGVWATAPDSAPAQESAFTVAVLRRDGVILPVASFDGRKWTRRWEDSSGDVPISLADVATDWWPARRPLTDWVAWPLQGESRPIRATAPALVDIHCEKRIGLRTDYVSGEIPPPPDVQPYPKDGLAVSGRVPIERPELVDPRSPEGVRLAEGILARVNQAEEKAIDAWRRSWTHPASEQTRAAAPLSLEVLTTSPGPGADGRVLYFEGVKRYRGFIWSPQPGAPPRMCEYLTVASGWALSSSDGKLAQVDVETALSNCHREGISYLLPLGVVRTGGRIFWIVQASTWESERYEVLEIRDRDIRKAVVSKVGGACKAQG